MCELMGGLTTDRGGVGLVRAGFIFITIWTNTVLLMTKVKPARKFRFG